MEISQIFFLFRSIFITDSYRTWTNIISCGVKQLNGGTKKNFKLFQACHVTIDMVFVFELIDIFRNMK